MKKVKLRLSEVIKEQTGKDTGEYQVATIASQISEETGIPEDIVRRILIFVNFAMYKKDGSLTKFAEEANIANYKELYEYLKGIKQNYRNDHEIEAFTIKTNKMANSVYSRASAWIFNTFVKYEDMEDKEKYITSGLYAQAFFIKTFGQIMENLKILRKVFNKLEKEVVAQYVEEQNYTKQDNEE